MQQPWADGMIHNLVQYAGIMETRNQAEGLNVEIEYMESQVRRRGHAVTPHQPYILHSIVLILPTLPHPVCIRRDSVTWGVVMELRLFFCS